MEDSIHLIMKRIMIDIPIFERYVINTCTDNRFSMDLYVDNLKCDYIIKDLRNIDFHYYFKLLGISSSNYSIDLKCVFSPSDYEIV